jgi:hypothetical protein
MSTNFELRDRVGSNLSYGDTANYKHMLAVSSKLSTARNRTTETDSFRVTIADRMLDTASACSADECGQPRTDRALFEFSIALGQPDAYYARKKEQLVSILTAVGAIYNAFDSSLKLGVLPTALRGDTITTVNPV